MRKSIMGITMLVLLTAASCKKEKNEIRLTTDAIAGDYKITAITMNAGSGETDVKEFFMEDCQQDDIIHFKKDQTLSITDDGLQCNPATAETGTWSLPGNNKMTLDGDEADVKVWNGKDLHLSRAEEVNGQAAVITFKFLRK